MRRCWLSVFGCLWVLMSACTFSHAQTAERPAKDESRLPVAIELSASQLASKSAAGSLFQPESIVVLQNAPSELTVEQVAAMPASAFALFDPRKTYTLSTTKALWLHFRVSGPAASANLSWTFELPKPSVDLVEFYSLNALRAWDKQQAGNWFAQAKWAVRGMHPQFALPPLVAGPNDFYVKVSQAMPLRFKVTLKTAESASFDRQNALLINSLLLGLMVCVSLFTFALALVYQNKIYAWYAGYVFFAFLAIASYLGVASYAFWPASAWPANLLSQVFLAAAIATQVEFSRVLFIRPRARPRTSWFMLITALVIAATALHALFAPPLGVELRIGILFAAFLVGTLTIFAVVLHAALEHRLMAWLWMVAYTPVIAVLTLTMVEQFGVAPVPWLPYNAIGLAVGFEVLTLLIALQLHVKSHHEWHIRQATLVEIDPLTGFLAPLYFPDTLAQLWSETRHMRQDLAVAYVRADIDLNGARDAVKISNDQLVLRCVRMLRMVTRPDDTVARIGGNLFAILMPRMSTGSNLAGKLSRLVALGVMRDTDDPSQQIVRFRIAATTFSSFSGTSKQLDEALKQKLNSLTAASERTIEFVRA